MKFDELAKLPEPEKLSPENLRRAGGFAQGDDAVQRIPLGRFPAAPDFPKGGREGLCERHGAGAEPRQERGGALPARLVRARKCTVSGRNREQSPRNRRFVEVSFEEYAAKSGS